MEKEKNTKAYFKSVLTFMLLFILPLGSIYFLTKGKNFNRAVFEELKDKGKMSSFTVLNQKNLPITSDSLYGRVAVVNFFAEDEAKAKMQAEQMGKVHASFDDTEDVYFLSFVHKDTSKSLLDRSMALGIEDEEQWSLAELDKKDWDKINSGVFNIKGTGEGAVLVDTSLSIRHYYDGFNDTLIGNLVLHISKVIPKQQRRGL